MNEMEKSKVPDSESGNVYPHNKYYDHRDI